jgi:serine/threonine protein kinase
MIPAEQVAVQAQLGTSPTSQVYLVKVAPSDSPYNVQLCVARHVLAPSRQFWREISVWSTLRHPNVVSFIGACVSSVGPLSICEHFPEGSLFSANASLLAQAQDQADAAREAARHSAAAVAAAAPGCGGADPSAGLPGAGGPGAGVDRSSSVPPAGCNGHPVAFGMRSGWSQLSYAKQICRAMAYLHSLTPCPVLFRNLKSTNVMLADGHSRVALTDFAICRPLAPHANLTPAQGSDRWLAPEVQVGGEYDLRADVFSYAMTIWEVVTCEVPFAPYSTRQAAMLIAKGYRPILPSHCPSWEMKLMACCNAQLPSARPTFSTLLRVLEEACDPAMLSAALDPLLHAAQQAMAAAGMTIVGEPPPVLAKQQ